MFYLGEEVDFYDDEQRINHGGTLLDGGNGAKLGIIMPGKAIVGMKYYQELAPNVAMDRAKIVSLIEEIENSAGVFKKCLKTKEGTAINPIEVKYKSYSSGIGLIQDQNLLFVKFGFINKWTLKYRLFEYLKELYEME